MEADKSFASAGVTATASDASASVPSTVFAMACIFISVACLVLHNVNAVKIIHAPTQLLDIYPGAPGPGSQPLAGASNRKNARVCDHA